MNPQQPFIPRGSFNATPTCSAQIAVTAAVQTLALPAVPNAGAALRLVVAGSQNVAWCFGNNANLTMTNGVVMLPNTVESFGVPGGTTQISVIGAAVGSTIIAHVGDGQ